MLQPRHNSISKEEEDDEMFIKESTELAKSFTELFISTQQEAGETTKSPLRSCDNNPAPVTPTGEHATLVSLAAASMPAMADVAPLDARSNAIADSLKIVAGRIDRQLLDAKFTDSQRQVLDNHGRTIWDTGYNDFCAIMRGVFRSLDDSMRERSNGWEIAALVFRGVAGLVRDLRRQNGDQNHGSRAREGTLQGYVGIFLEEVGLLTWITGQGGLGQWGNLNGQVETYSIDNLFTNDVTETSV